VKRKLTCAFTLAVTIFSVVTLTTAFYTPPAAAAPARPVPVVAAKAPVTPLLAVALAASRYLVRSGDSLSVIAVRYCGHANDWTGIYEQNRHSIGSNPNLILPGQVLSIGRCTDPPKLLRLGSVQPHPHVAPHATLHRAASGKVWKVTYGYPYKCGDGDNDGWDVACTARTALPVRHQGSTRQVYHATYSGSGVYSYGGLEALWVSAGGPAWAAAHAASIAECESGGNVGAHNPSGATGLWQILGAVVGGSLYNPYVNAANAVSKFRASGDTFAQWVCQ
jgi:hypothetical protein